MYNFDPYNVLLSIATNIPVLLMTAFVLQAHILSSSSNMLNATIRHEDIKTSFFPCFESMCIVKSAIYIYIHLTWLGHRYLLAAVLGLPELVSFVLHVLLLQCLYGWDDESQGFIRLLRVVDHKRGVLLLLGSVIHRLTATRLWMERRDTPHQAFTVLGSN